MPLVAWLSNRGTFGLDNATLSARYPTPLVAAGYAFSIWGPIFLLDLAYAVQQLRTADERRTRAPAALAFLLTSTWMIVFSREWFWVSLGVIVASLVALLVAALRLSGPGKPTSEPAGARVPWLPWLALSLQAGWVSLAAFLNLAQVLVAARLVDTGVMLGWSLPLFVACAVLLFWANARMRGNAAYAGAALWGFVGVYVGQSRSVLPGGELAARIALMLGLALSLQTVWLYVRRSRRDAELTTAA